MKFKLNELHRNMSNDDLIQDVRQTSEKIGKTTLTADEYSQFGKYHSCTLTRRFGSWKTILELAGLETTGHSFYISDEEYIMDLQRVALLLGKDTVSFKEYTKDGKYSAGKLSLRFGSWENALEAASLHKTGHNVSISDEQMLIEIERLWTTLGRQPTSTDIKAGKSLYGLTSYIRHFGSWRKALEAFIEYIDTDDNEENEIPLPKESLTITKEIRHTTKRDVSDRMRFKILARDNFKCCACGASPAKDPSVVLHVDHIFPWSKGGETVPENLQTLCNKCNLGKGDMII